MYSRELDSLNVWRHDAAHVAVKEQGAAHCYREDTLVLMNHYCENSQIGVQYASPA